MPRPFSSMIFKMAATHGGSKNGEDPGNEVSTEDGEYCNVLLLATVLSLFSAIAAVILVIFFGKFDRVCDF